MLQFLQHFHCRLPALYFNFSFHSNWESFHFLKSPSLLIWAPSLGFLPCDIFLAFHWLMFEWPSLTYLPASSKLCCIYFRLCARFVENNCRFSGLKCLQKRSFKFGNLLIIKKVVQERSSLEILKSWNVALIESKISPEVRQLQQLRNGFRKERFSVHFQV